MAEGLIPGIPAATRILLLGQVQEDVTEDFSEPFSANETVLEHVLRSDKKRERFLYEASRLSTAMDNVEDPAALLKVYRQLKRERLQRGVDEAKQRAAKTSGVRGSGARKALTALEEELAVASMR
jgi:ATP-binding cassette subfamily F protein 3